MKYHLTSVRMAIIKKSTNSKCWRGCGEKWMLLHCWWEFKLIQPLWKMVWRFILSFLRPHPSTAFQILLLTMSSTPFLQRDSCHSSRYYEFNSPISIHLSSLIPKMSMFTLNHLLLDHIQFTLIHGPNIPGSYEIFFFTALDFTFTTRHIHNWTSFPLWHSSFILSGDISNCPLFFPSSILDIFPLGGSSFSVISFFVFSYCSYGSLGKNTGVTCHAFLQWTTVCQNSSPWPICLGLSCTPWPITPLSYAILFNTTRLWSIKGLI